jgi:hypothetical protein
LRRHDAALDLRRARKVFGKYLARSAREFDYGTIQRLISLAVTGRTDLPTSGRRNSRPEAARYFGETPARGFVGSR